MQIWELDYSFPSGSVIKDPPANTGDARDTRSIPGVEDPLEEEMATHFSVLAWEIPWTEESGLLWSRGSQRVGHNWDTEQARMHAGCLNRTPHTGWFKQQKFIFSQLWRLTVEDQDTSMSGLWWRLSFWLLDGHILTLYSPGLSSCLGTRASGVGSKLTCVFYYKDPNPIKPESHPHDLI